MKTLTKKDLPIGTKVVPHDKTAGYSIDKCPEYTKFKNQGFLYVVGHHQGYLYLSSETTGNISFYNYSDVTLYQEKPKVKKSELLEMIKGLESKVNDLNISISDLQIKNFSDMNANAGLNHFSAVDKPKFEVGKVYKGENVIFMCTLLNDGNKPFGYGIAFGDWMENNNEDHWDTSSTEATEQEWFEALSNYAIENGYVKGVKIGGFELTGGYFNNGKNTYLTAYCYGRIDADGIEIMQDGKWIPLDKPQYEIGATYAFADGEYYFENSNFLIGQLERVDFDEEYPFVRKEGAIWKYARRIGYTLK